MTKQTKPTIGRRSGRSRRGGLRWTHTQQEARLRGFAAINRVRKGQSKSLSHAARVEGTTLQTIRQLLPGAVSQDRSGGRIRVKASDRYSARVQITTSSGPLDVTARGSRERELAGRHRAAIISVQRNLQPASILLDFRGKTVGGHELLADLEQPSIQAQAGILPQLDSLYVSPDTNA